MYMRRCSEPDSRLWSSGGSAEILQWYSIRALRFCVPTHHIATARMQQEIERSDKQVLLPSEVKATSILIFILSLLGEHCDFDRLRHENSGAL